MTYLILKLKKYIYLYEVMLLCVEVRRPYGYCSCWSIIVIIIIAAALTCMRLHYDFMLQMTNCPPHISTDVKVCLIIWTHTAVSDYVIK
jgi:hypothetical protein